MANKMYPEVPRQLSRLIAPRLAARASELARLVFRPLCPHPLGYRASVGGDADYPIPPSVRQKIEVILAQKGGGFYIQQFSFAF